eukprot:g12946.t1
MSWRKQQRANRTKCLSLFIHNSSYQNIRIHTGNMGSGSSGLKRNECSKYWRVSKKILGKGSFATVRRAIKVNLHDTDRKEYPEEVAAKIIDKKSCASDVLPTLKDEVKIMLKINDAGCVRLYEIFESDRHLILMVELCRGGDLFDRIAQKETYDESEAADVVRQVAQALKYLHDHNIVHRDLKPENLIYKEKAGNVLKLTDFGLAKYIDSEATTNISEKPCGTPIYVAPEVLTASPVYSPKVDMWSLGVLAYILLCGFPPFDADENDLADLFQVIKAGKYNFLSPYWDDVSKSAKDLISKLLEVNPEVRYSARQVLSHPWICDGSKRSAATLGGHVQGGIVKICAKAKWKKAISRTKMVGAIGKMRKTARHAVKPTEEKQSPFTA